MSDVPGMKNLFRGLVAMVVLSTLVVGSVRAAGTEWERWETPEEAGFSSSALNQAEALWRDIPDAPSSAFMLVYRGKVLASFGSETYPFWCHSMRKSFLSALYGVQVAKGEIDLDATLEDLGIDDTTPLTAEEKQARVRHLLKARSGIYIEAACEAQSMKDARPARGSHAPDTFWYYNNWDFNALGAIFRQETGRDIFGAFKQQIARKIGMQDFQTGLCEYSYESNLSMHPCYTFRMSTRDRAKFGQLFLQNGRWGRKQIVPKDWIDESTHPWSWDETPGRGYGYMWWVYEPDFFQLFFDEPDLHLLHGYAASGYGGQGILVLPDADMVLVFSADVYAGADLDILETAPMLEVLLTGRPRVDLRMLRAKAKPKKASAGDTMRLIGKAHNRSSTPSEPTTVDFYLSPTRQLGDDARLLATSTLGQVGGGRRKASRTRAELPEDVEPGRYFLLAVVDGDKTNYDFTRANNLKVGRKITVR